MTISLVEATMKSGSHRPLSRHANALSTPCQRLPTTVNATCVHTANPLSRGWRTRGGLVCQRHSSIGSARASGGLPCGHGNLSGP
jgi:hypothetical protein